MSETVAVFGASFNPPGMHHRRTAEELLRHFDRVVIVPCGPRPDKPSTAGVGSIHRAAMADLAFHGLDRVEVDLFDLEQENFTRTHRLDQRYSARGQAWHVVSGDMIAGGCDGEAVIQRTWQYGPELWQRLKFAVVHRPGMEISKTDLPPNHRMISIDREGSSFVTRERLFRGESIDALVPPDVGDYIIRHNLYGDAPRSRAIRATLADPRVLIVADQRNHKAKPLVEHFQQYSRPEDPNCVLAIGGDGTMLHAIQQHWRLRLPFFGINVGHLGFLLNTQEEAFKSRFPLTEMVAWHMPLLYVQMRKKDGTWTSGLTFNDAWMERATGQSAWLEVEVDDNVRLKKLVCDGVLLSTAAGSTAYARSMGATPLLADTPAWLMVGSNVMQPINWKSAMLSLESNVEVRSLDPLKRPLIGYLYGISLGEVTVMRARISRIAAVELAFCPSHDITEKIRTLQFPAEEVNAL